MNEIKSTTRINQHCYLLFFMYPSILRVWGVLIPTNAWQDMVGVVSSEVASSIYFEVASSWDASSSFGSSSS